MQNTGETVGRKDEGKVHSLVNCRVSKRLEQMRGPQMHLTAGGACNEYIFVALGFFSACTRTTLIPKYLAPMVCQRGRQAQ